MLEKASLEGYTEVVRLLLEAGADVNAFDGQYRNALHAASSAGRVTTVRLLLDQGADVNATDGVRSTALQAAISVGCEKTTRLLLDQGAEHHTALQAAVSAGHAKTIQLLLDQGADVTAHGEYDKMRCRRHYVKLMIQRLGFCLTRPRISMPNDKFMTTHYEMQYPHVMSQQFEDC